MSSNLKEARARLDEVDQQLIEALAHRQQLVGEVATIKAAHTDQQIQDAGRETAILERLRGRAEEAGLPPHLVIDLYERIFAHSVRHQVDHLLDTDNPDRATDELVVAYQGADGAYSQLAAQNHFGAHRAALRCHGYSTFAGTVEAVEEGEAHYAILPIENTTAGSINETYDLLATHKMHIVGEEVLQVKHCLLTLGPVPLRALRCVYSHPQALAQCSDFLSSVDGLTAQTYLDTALAAKKIREDGDGAQAAIASRQAGEKHDLHVLRDNIADEAENHTRWVVVASQALACDERLPCKTSLLFSTEDEEGALMRCLNALAARGINITTLESRPKRREPWSYRFYVDIEGNVAADHVEAAIRELRPLARNLRVLGTYPTGQADRGEELPVPSRNVEEAEEEKPEVVVSGDVPYQLAARSHRPEGTQIQVGDVTIGSGPPVLIAGPCSVESREQTLACAEAVHQAGGHILRGGCFKPRTSPYSFQGLGYEGLDILEEAGRRYGLPIITEVLHPSDVPAVARQADILQIGARNMQNFPLLKAIGGADRPVMLKRGMMASIDEWLSAAEYILSHGNPRVMLCERGIRTFETATRFTLDISAVPVVRERTHLPIIVDPAHACGERRWIPDLVKAARAAGADGVMIETHPNPDDALSDGPQSLPFPMLSEVAASFRTDHSQTT